MGPENRISNKARIVWMISSLLLSLIGWAVAGGAFILFVYRDISMWIPYALSLAALLGTVFGVWVLPALRIRHWRYEVREKEIEIQKGIFVIRRTLIPMARVQHVDTKQGPLLARYGLSSVEVSTAASSHEIPALAVGEAEQLRKYISAMASVEEGDV
ncbi:PH domain-containing protein [Peribacillus sp. SCS-37]|uniref:PH domain-containing protein n=1 Tax=Paraperibacillus esterisolvens TaxID=3115296 RepID=UPI0039058404